jgi:hypothetical protein
MCGTKNDANAQACSFCGYIFEDYSSTGSNAVTSSTGSFSSMPSALPQPSKQAASSPSRGYDAPPRVDSPDQTNPIPATPSYSSNPSANSLSTPLFVVSRSLLATLAPTIGYLVFIALFTLIGGLSLITIAVVVVFLIAAVVPSLFSPRRFEFYDNSLRMHKTIGSDTEIQYSDLSLYDVPQGRRSRITLSAAGQNRPIVIPGNPTNKELGMDLNQFLNSKLKKRSVGQRGFGRGGLPATSTPDDSQPSSNTGQANDGTNASL